MSFFTEVDSLGIIENHIQQVLELEDKEAKRVIKSYRTIRRDLQDRLGQLPDGEFRTDQLRMVLAQVDGAIFAMNHKLKSGMNLSSEQLAKLGAEHVEDEVNTFNKAFDPRSGLLSVNQIAISTEVHSLHVYRNETSIDAYSAAVRQKLTQGITNSLIEKASLPEVVSKLGKFLQAEEWKLLRLARTELHNVYNLGKLKSLEDVQESLPGLKKTLIHPMDGRTGDDSKAAAATNQIRDLDKPFSYRYNGKTITFMTPPDRPNDRAILVPYRKDWE